MTKMFPFITQTCNPLGGECKHRCTYCWATSFKNRYERLQIKYGGEPRIVQKELNRVHKFSKEDYVFICTMTDLFGNWVPDKLIDLILSYIKESPATFLLLTKNPARYKNFNIPHNCVCGATIESDCDHLVSLGAPKVSDRLQAMEELTFLHKVISVEPIMRFSSDFAKAIIRIKPEIVAVGYDNYNNGLDEPSMAETELLIKELENNGIKVYRKTIREKNGE
jgi:DNA repair photolyase